jgi:hypothetical protein
MLQKLESKLLENAQTLRRNRGPLRSMFQGLLGTILVISMTACTSLKQRPEIEMWLIDGKEQILYRKLNNGKYQIIPIEDNSDMNKFLVIDKREYQELILFYEGAE